MNKCKHEFRQKFIYGALNVLEDDGFYCIKCLDEFHDKSDLDENDTFN